MKTIVIVEDEYVNALLLKEMLKEFDFEIIILANGDTLMGILENKEVHLILMDVRLPGLDGYELTIMVKEKYPNLPVVIQTAYAFQSDMEKAQEIGCDGYMPKPINKSKLIKLVNSFIKI